MESVQSKKMIPVCFIDENPFFPMMAYIYSLIYRIYLIPGKDEKWLDKMAYLAPVIYQKKAKKSENRSQKVGEIML